MLSGQLTRLRPLEDKDFAYYYSCMDNPDLAGVVLGDAVPSPRELTKKLLQKQDDLLLTVETLSGTPVGFCFLRNMHPIHRFAELEQFFIGNPRDRRRGHGEDAIRTLTRYCFSILGLNRVWLITYAYNFSAIRFYEKCGFSKEGVLRQIQFTGREYHDGVTMAILQQDWIAMHKRHRSPHEPSPIGVSR